MGLKWYLFSLFFFLKFPFYLPNIVIAFNSAIRTGMDGSVFLTLTAALQILVVSVMVEVELSVFNQGVIDFLMVRGGGDI